MQFGVKFQPLKMDFSTPPSICMPISHSSSTPLGTKFYMHLLNSPTNKNVETYRVLLLCRMKFFPSKVGLFLSGNAKKDFSPIFACLDLKIGEAFSAQIWCTYISTN